MELDLLSLDSVVGFCNLWNARLSPLHVLINNAGIFSMGGWFYCIVAGKNLSFFTFIGELNVLHFNNLVV